MATQYPRTCEYLESIGIEPSTVCESGVTVNGYDSLDLDENGARRLVGDEIAKVRKPWPTPIAGVTVLGLMRKDRARR